ncbi:hypothetical protein PR002_g22574 [Phytophthora rubi]|uniref:Uncharacterized protein n=1 Tax=Phytophthora rubi TaxID=129364 RepID=A0A6A3IU58_9STRA|nr:hypothetical protein PR002_g22574 [Phytophthora rubi]
MHVACRSRACLLAVGSWIQGARRARVPTAGSMVCAATSLARVYKQAWLAPALA